MTASIEPTLRRVLSAVQRWQQSGCCDTRLEARVLELLSELDCVSLLEACDVSRVIMRFDNEISHAERVKIADELRRVFEKK